jgi:hypothetical protein
MSPFPFSTKALYYTFVCVWPSLSSSFFIAIVGYTQTAGILVDWWQQRAALAGNSCTACDLLLLLLLFFPLLLLKFELNRNVEVVIIY